MFAAYKRGSMDYFPYLSLSQEWGSVNLQHPAHMPSYFIRLYHFPEGKSVCGEKQADYWNIQYGISRTFMEERLSPLNLEGLFLRP